MSVPINRNYSLITSKITMIPRVCNVLNALKKFEKYVLQMFKYPPRELALAFDYDKPSEKITKKFSLNDLIGDGFLLAVPKFRRTVEKRWKRKFGSPDYIWKMLVPKTNIIVCYECGHYHENGRLCGNCYKKVEAETKEIQEKIQEKLGTNKPIENDVIVLYDGDQLPEKPQEFWQGKRVIEMKKERPKWFSKNLLQKTTQAPSESKDVKPTDLA
ncbi:large ribosomal subunit protein bL32m isoform X2 [Danaus plexippus]|uniref:large ribosomal subunit protein bL32m isoform X2 n=1 Tax=Danaus plexippus TaxID=13037 RepID=UPI002AB22111|nr:large ribosomal subunit protein bL32m isoform X2 [Danaus plexippus]